MEARMNLYSLFLRDSKLWAAQLPEKPYICDHKGNLDACANERCWDLEECQDETKTYKLAHAKALSEALLVDNPEITVREEVNHVKFFMDYCLLSQFKEDDYYEWTGPVHIATQKKVENVWIDCLKSESNGSEDYRQVIKLLPLSGTSQPEQKLTTENSGFSIETKVCDKCGSVLEQTMTTGLRMKVVSEGETQEELTFEAYLKLLGVDRHHAIAVTIWDTLDHQNFHITRIKK